MLHTRDRKEPPQAQTVREDGSRTPWGHNASDSETLSGWYRETATSEDAPIGSSSLMIFVYSYFLFTSVLLLLFILTFYYIFCKKWSKCDILFLIADML